MPQLQVWSQFTIWQSMKLSINIHLIDRAQYSKSERLVELMPGLGRGGHNLQNIRPSITNGIHENMTH